MEQLAQLLELGPGHALLDVGGRTGSFSARFAGTAGRVVILEPDAPATRAGRRRHPEFLFQTGIGERIPFPDRSFDRITAIRSTHHMESPERFLEEAFRVLRGDGRIVLEELTPGSGLGRLFSTLFRWRHHHGLDLRAAEDWEAALKRAGFASVGSTRARRWYFVTGRKAPEGAGSPGH